MRSEHDAFQPAILILQRKIHMPAGMMREIRYFAAKPDIAKQMVRFQLHADVAVNFFDRKNRDRPPFGFVTPRFDLAVCCFERIMHQHCNRHRSNAARNWSYIARCILNILVIHIASKLAVW